MGVSRTTAYRYFANQTALLVAAHPEVGAESMLYVAGQTRDEAADTMRWSARAMLTSPLEGRTPGP